MPFATTDQGMMNVRRPSSLPSVLHVVPLTTHYPTHHNLTIRYRPLSSVSSGNISSEDVGASSSSNSNITTKGVPSTPSHPATATPPSTLHDIMKQAPPFSSNSSAGDQEVLLRQAGKELGRAWKQEGGVKPGIARFERILQGEDVEAMERCWKEMRKEGLDFWHMQKFLGLLLEDRYLDVRGNGGSSSSSQHHHRHHHQQQRRATKASSGELPKQRLRLAWSIFDHMTAVEKAAAKEGGKDGAAKAAQNSDDVTESAPAAPGGMPTIASHHWGRVYSCLLKACATVGDGSRAKELSEHMESAGILPGEESLSNLVMALAKTRIRHEAQEQFERARRRGLTLSSAAKSCLISCHARALDGAAAAHVLSAAIQEATLNDNPGQVSGNMVKKVLEVGIETGDVSVLQQGLRALSVPVDRGMALQILNVAARKGDGKLAMDMFYASEGWGYAPTAPAFNAVVQALGMSKNDVAMLKALNEMCAWGFSPSSGTLHLLARQLSQSVTRLDEAYNNLVAMRRANEGYVRAQEQQLEAEGKAGEEVDGGGKGDAGATAPIANAPLPVSASAVYLIVLGCAYGNQLDRAFATFEDYGPVFGLAHDTAVCNALLMACVRSRSLQLGAATSVMTEMNRLGVAPDDETCHLMVRILVQAKEADAKRVEQVLLFMDQKGVVPRASTQRLLILWHALLGEHDRAQELLSGLQAQGEYMPSYIEERLQQIRENGDRL